MENETEYQEQQRLRSYKRKHSHNKFNSEELGKTMFNLTNKINELSDELEIVGELFEHSLKFKEVIV